MTVNAFFNAYLDINIVLLFAAAVWAILKFGLARTPLKQAFSQHLQIVYGALIAIAMAPVIVFAFGWAQHLGVFGTNYSISVSEFAVAQFLNGHIDMAPSRFEALLAARNIFTLNVTELSSSLGVAVAAFLVAGLAFCSFKTMRNSISVAKIVRRSYIWRKMGNVEIRLTDQTLVPFSTRGIRTHYIILPSSLLSQSNDMRIAVAHELQHIRQQDLFWEIALEMLRPIFFWNPAYTYWKREVERLRELACDQQVLTRKSINVRAYCDCLLRICHNSLQVERKNQILVPSVPFAQVDASRSGGRSAQFLKYRVLSLLDRPRLRPSKIVTLGLVSMVSLAISFGSIASQPAGDWSQDRLMLSTIVNLERLNIRNGAGN